MSWLTGLRPALSLLTVVGPGAAPGPEGPRWFGVVGAGLGLTVGMVWWAAALVWPPLVAAAVALLADMALTGLIHFDGLADSADALLPHMGDERRLEVMRAPDVGAFGATALAAVTVARFAALASLAPAPLLTGALWATSRSIMAWTMGTVAYARSGGGMPTSFAGADPRVAAGLSLIGAGLLAGLWDPLLGPAAVLITAAAAAGVVTLGALRLGGYTGDVLGACGVAGETAGLLMATASW